MEECGDQTTCARDVEENHFLSALRSQSSLEWIDVTGRGSQVGTTAI